MVKVLRGQKTVPMEAGRFRALDEFELGFHIVEKFLLVVESQAGFFDKFDRGFLDITRIIEASLKRVDFATKL